jgi:D-2-hydroxyglutarate dehydrogenase
MEKLEAFVKECGTLDQVVDAVVAQDSSQAQNIWRIREGIPESIIRHGMMFSRQ